MTRFRSAFAVFHIFFVLALVALLAGSTTGQQLPPAFPRDGAKKILENDRVIVWDMELQKGQRAAMHTHPYDIVSVTLTPGGHKDNGADGVSEDRMFKMGDVRFTPKGRTHFEMGLTDPPRRAIVTELKAIAPGGAPAASKYPPAYPREGARKILENDRVILWDVTLENNRRTAMHDHPYDFMSVTLTPGAIRDVGSDGVIEERRFEVGQVRFQNKGRIHADEGASPVPRRSIVIEFK
jgi:quercetin dioxygenase-like cupin family protein